MCSVGSIYARRQTEINKKHDHAIQYKKESCTEGTLNVGTYQLFVCW